jgi:hypothetical protein
VGLGLGKCVNVARGVGYVYVFIESRVQKL